jgi:Tol biopolymer transport system component
MRQERSHTTMERREAPRHRMMRYHLGKWLAACLILSVLMAWTGAQTKIAWCDSRPPGPLATYPLSIPGSSSWNAPVPSPDGRWLAFTTSDYRGIYLQDLGSRQITRLNDEPGAGYRFAWAPDSSGLAYRKRSGPSRLSIVFVHTDGTEESASALLPSVSTPFFVGSDLVFFRFDESGPVEMRSGPTATAQGGPPSPVAVTPHGRLWLQDSRGAWRERESDPRVYYNPILTQDRRRFVVECLDGHMYMGEAGKDGLRDLGPGSYPSFVTFDRSLLFERTSDNGHQLTAGDLYLMDLESGAVTPLTETPDVIERRPAMSSDGQAVFFEASGNLYEGIFP